MQYGYFDDDKKEYVITNPATPKSWSNYLGSTEYGAIITNNAGGYSFYKSGGMGRFMRMRFNSIPMDQPGRYLYLREEEDGDFWSSSWQPVGKDLQRYNSICRHGTGYTIIESNFKKIKCETKYFVPLNSKYELWKVKITNLDDRSRKLKLFTYVEYAANWNAIDDLLNIQYVQYTSQMNIVDNIIDHGTNIFIPEMPDNFKEKDQGRHTFQALVGSPINGYDTDREKFIGEYRTYANPKVVEIGTSNNSLGYGDNPCGSLQTEIDLEPNQSKELLIVIGIGKAEVEGKKLFEKYQNLEIVENELKEVKEFWHNRISGFTARTPDNELNSTINTWGIYNSLVTFAWSRAASLIYTGIDRDGLGYRDTVQDFMGVTSVIPNEVKERLELMITGQTSTGGAMPVVLPISHSPGKEKLPKDEEYRSDDTLWLFNAIPYYVKETGDIDFYNKILPYADKGEDTVLGHLKKSIQFSIDKSGKHGLPYGLSADWNDCLKFGFNGESVFVAMQLRLALVQYSEIANLLELSEEKKWSAEQLKTLDENIQKYAWDGKWFLRGFRYDGMKFGSNESEEGKIFLNPQTWSIISGAATNEQALSSMESVNNKLFTEYGTMICDPPFTNSDYNIVRAQLMNPGLKENGGIFVHTQGWIVIAESILGNGNNAYKYLRAYLPAAYNEKAEIREIEPYVVCQSTHSKHSPKHGASRIPWLSGSATWTYYAITNYVLGIRPEYYGLTIDPCIPNDWKTFSVQRNYRGKYLDISFSNPNKKEKGVEKIILNGKDISKNFIPIKLLNEKNKIEVFL
jgi:cellobiose phosphorylase